MEALQKLLTDELADLYDAEQQILKALPKMIAQCSSSELQQALQEHLTVTQKQVTRLDQVFREFDEKPSKKCKGMAGIISEGDEMLKEDLEDATKDAAIIAAAQKVEHYEIASYGTARTLAEFLGKQRAAELLEETLDEEKEADELLTQIAESSINTQAASEEGEVAENKRSGNGRSRPSSTAKSKQRTQRTRSRRPRAKAGR